MIISIIFIYTGEVCERAEEEPIITSISTSSQLAERETSGRTEKSAGIVSQSETVFPVYGRQRCCC